jgi:hypothetical protein
MKKGTTGLEGKRNLFSYCKKDTPSQRYATPSNSKSTKPDEDSVAVLAMVNMLGPNVNA